VKDLGKQAKPGSPRQWLLQHCVGCVGDHYSTVWGVLETITALCGVCWRPLQHCVGCVGVCVCALSSYASWLWLSYGVLHFSCLQGRINHGCLCYL